jgi:hypothetical protein
VTSRRDPALRPAARLPRRRSLAADGRKTAVALAVLFAVAAAGTAGTAVAGAGVGPVVGAGAGLVVVVIVAMLGVSTDRIMWITVSVLVLTITWNGIRVHGGAVGDVFMAMAFAAVVVHYVLHKRSPGLPPWLLLAGLGFLLAGLLVVMFPPNLGLANRAIVQQESLLIVPGYLPPRSDLSFLIEFELSVVLVPLIVAAAATNRRRCTQLLNLWALGTVVNAAVGIADLAGLHLAPNPIAASRSSGLTIHPNYLALSAVMGIPAAMIWIGRSRRWTAAGLVSVAILLGGVYVSGSRAGTVAAAVAVFATALLMPRLRRRAVPLLPYAGMALLVVLTFTKVGSQAIHQLRFGGNTSASGSDLQRGQDAQLAFAQIGARPFAGVGFSVIQDAHDIYLQVLAAGGIVAMAAFLVYLGGLASAARRAWAVAPRDEVVVVTVTIGIWLVNGVFDDQLADKYLYVMPGLLLALSRLGVAAAARDKARRVVGSTSPVVAPAAAGYPAARSPALASPAAGTHSTT